MRLWTRAFMVLVGLAVFAVYAGGAIGGYLLLAWLVATPPDLLVTLALVAAFTLVSAYFSYRFGTARLLAGLEAVELPRRRAPRLYRRLDGLAGRMGLDSPPILIANLEAPNALSLGGPRGGVIVVDRSLLNLLTLDELEGIVAHELAHMERYDTFIQTLAVSLMRSLGGLVTLLLLPVLLLAYGVDRAVAWIRGDPTREQGLAGTLAGSVDLFVGFLLSVATLLFLSHSRRREYAADARAAEVTGKPVALARALSKIHRATDPAWGLRSLLYIHGDEQEEDGLERLLSTHPPIEERIERLLDRAERMPALDSRGRLRA
jgi:heat shock protein HtpX